MFVPNLWIWIECDVNVQHRKFVIWSETEREEIKEETHELEDEEQDELEDEDLDNEEEWNSYYFEND